MALSDCCSAGELPAAMTERADLPPAAVVSASSESVVNGRAVMVAWVSAVGGPRRSSRENRRLRALARRLGSTAVNRGALLRDHAGRGRRHGHGRGPGRAALLHLDELLL